MAFKRLAQPSLTDNPDRYFTNYDQTYSQQKGQPASRVRPAPPPPPAPTGTPAIEIVTTDYIPPDLRNLPPPMPRGWKTNPSLIPTPARIDRSPAMPPAASPVRPPLQSPAPAVIQPGAGDQPPQPAPVTAPRASATASRPPVKPRKQPQAAAPVTPLIPQLPAASTALANTMEPSGPLEVLPSVASQGLIDRSRGYPTYNKQQMMGINPLTQPASRIMPSTESERAMEAYAAQRAARNGNEIGMTSIDQAREAYINQGARPVLDVNRPGAPVVAKQKRGFGEILRTAGVGALQGLAAGGLGGAIGGALTGGIIQAASPEMGRGVRFDTLQRPRLERQQQQRIAESQRQQQGRLVEAQIGNLESQAFERQAELALKAAEARRREKSVTLSGDETMFERDPQTGRLVPVATNPRQRFQLGNSNSESRDYEMKREDGLYKQMSVVEALKADMNRYGNSITDKASGYPQYREAKQKYEAEHALLMQRFGDMVISEPVQDQYGNTAYNLKMRNPNQRTPLLSPEEQKQAQTKKPASSKIAPRPKSALADLLNR